MTPRMIRTLLVSLGLIGAVAGPLWATRVAIQDGMGSTVQVYQESHALLIGVSQYRDWKDLLGVAEDVTVVKELLEAQGFHVVLVMNPADKAALHKAFNDFIEQYGYGPENRLLFYFAGHGKTLDAAYGGKMGYIVAANAPSSSDEVGFKRHALDMAMIEVYAKQIQAKHALFLFDSCFSGTLFTVSRGEAELISYKTANPVRQFITAGSEDEQVPDRSIFRRQLVTASQREGDLNRDGYVSGGELGLFLMAGISKPHGSRAGAGAGV